MKRKKRPELQPVRGDKGWHCQEVIRLKFVAETNANDGWINVDIRVDSRA